MFLVIANQEVVANLFHDPWKVIDATSGATTGQRIRSEKKFDSTTLLTALFILFRISIDQNIVVVFQDPGF